LAGVRSKQFGAARCHDLSPDVQDEQGSNTGHGVAQPLEPFGVCRIDGACGPRAFELVPDPGQCAVRAFELTDEVLVDDAGLGLEAVALLRLHRHAFAIERDRQDDAKQYQQDTGGQPLDTKAPGICER
jgi:hypothetical protein